MEVQVNFLAVLLAGVASMALGFIWYGPMAFGKAWAKEKGFTTESLKKAQKAMGPMYGVSFVLSLITAYILSHVMTLSMNFFHYDKMTTGMMTAFWMWLGFMMPVQMTATIFGNKNWKLLGMDTGYQLVSMLGMSFVMALF